MDLENCTVQVINKTFLFEHGKNEPLIQSNIEFYSPRAVLDNTDKACRMLSEL